MMFKQVVTSTYMDEEGLVSIDAHPTKWSSGNGLLYTCIYYTLLKLKNQLTSEDVANFTSLYKSLQSFPGTFNRNAGRTDLNAHDDLTGLVACSAIIEPNQEAAKAVFWHGIKHLGCFNNVDNKMTIRSFQWRHIDFMSHCFVSAYNIKALVPIQKQYIKNINLDDASGIILAWFQVLVLNDQNMANDFNTAIRTKYPNGMKDVFSAYFSPTHPFVVYYP